MKIYADRVSGPARAVLIYCKVNGIEFEEVEVNMFKREQLAPEFKKINPMKKVPAMVDGELKLFESHSILMYLACKFPGVAPHWYPADPSERAKIHSVLDWHQANLYHGTVECVLKRTLGSLLGVPLNPQAAAKAEKVVLSSLFEIETALLEGSGRFLLGRSEPSIADLSLVCVVMHLQVRGHVPPSSTC
ncbi:Glutathione S-transferase T1 [Turnera subulata]|uniref:Glutathione S-transferase T1 n=1 Tax=Turnera subulata TaxID=218843 RepID=A0A9Q0GFV1_9ROSI|nr:Glutathione S-transferase T1 [Turnera subulata]